jgi:hypothetical protein
MLHVSGLNVGGRSFQTIPSSRAFFTLSWFMPFSAFFLAK